MDSFVALEQISGTGKTIAIGIDFEGVRPGAQLGDLGEMLRNEMSLYRLRIPAYSDLLSGSNLDRLVQQCIAKVRGQSLNVSVVIGYCAGGHIGSALAQALFDELDLGTDLVVFDTSRMDRGVIVKEFYRSVESLAPVLDAPVSAEIIGKLQLNARTLREECRSLIDVYSNLVHEAAEKIGFDARIEAQIVASFSSYLRYLLMALEAQDRTPFVNTTRVFSCEYVDVIPDRGIESASPHDDLLISPEAIDIMRDLLASDRSRMRPGG